MRTRRSSLSELAREIEKLEVCTSFTTSWVPRPSAWSSSSPRPVARMSSARSWAFISLAVAREEAETEMPIVTLTEKARGGKRGGCGGGGEGIGGAGGGGVGGGGAGGDGDGGGGGGS